MVAAMVSHCMNQDSEISIYHVCTSSKNPLRLSDVSEFSNLFLSKLQSVINNSGIPITTSKLRIISYHDFQTHMMFQYVLPFLVCYYVLSLLCVCVKGRSEFSPWKNYQGATYRWPKEILKKCSNYNISREFHTG